MLNVWKNKHEDIAILFRNRNKQEAEGPMILFAAHLLSVVYWLNEQPVHSLNEMQINTNKLKVQPVNFMERYSFIIKKPSNYHSYIQLAQLYIEIEKLYVKKMITKEVRFSLRETDFFCILGLCCNNSTVCVRCISSGILVLLFLLFLSLFFSFFLASSSAFFLASSSAFS